MGLKNPLFVKWTFVYIDDDDSPRQYIPFSVPVLDGNGNVGEVVNKFHWYRNISFKIQKFFFNKNDKLSVGEKK